MITDGRRDVVRGIAVLVCLAVGMATGSVSADDVLPDAARAAVKARFPNAKITEVEREREGGIVCYEVECRLGRREIELTVAADGSIGAVEEEISPKALPAPVVAGVHRLAGRKVRLHEAERVSTVGVPRNGTFEPLKTPVISYEVEWRGGECRVDPEGNPVQRSTTDDDDDEDDDDDDE